MPLVPDQRTVQQFATAGLYPASHDRVHARRRGRSRHRLPVGATVHAAAGRCGPLRPARAGDRGSWMKPTSRSTACGGTCTGPSTSTGRSSTCSSPTVATARRPAGSSTGVDHVEGDAVRGGHRRRAGLPAGPRRAGAGGVASRRAVCEQPDRGRPRPTQTPAATHARATHRPHRSGHHRRARVPPEPAPRPLRTRHRNRHSPLRVAAAFTELAQAI